jgi:glycerol-3-phosphate dehydrogenase (NAD(P)+)
VGWGLAAGRALPDILRELGMVAEGVRTTRTVQRVAEREGLYMPITAALARILDGDVDVHQALAGLMEQPARAEVDADSVALR